MNKELEKKIKFYEKHYNHLINEAYPAAINFKDYIGAKAIKTEANECLTYIKELKSKL